MLDQGYQPDTISTDLNVFNIGGPVFSFSENMTKMLALGLDVADVIAMATSNSARAIGKLGEYGSLEVGRSAEISVVLLEDPAFGVRKSAMYYLGQLPPDPRLASVAWDYLGSGAALGTHLTEALLHGQEIRHGLARVRRIGEAVDDWDR